MASTSKSAKSIKHLIEKFCSITGASRDVAKKMLEACDSNLEMAINMHVDAAETPQTADDRLTSALNATEQAAQCFPDSVEENVRAPIPPTRGILVEEPFSFGVHARRKPARSIFDGFRDFEAETRRQEQELWNPSNVQNKHKKQTLEDLFRPPVDLMHKGTFDTAREQGQIHHKWVMVNVQNVQEFSCQLLNRDVWSNQSVRKILEQHFIFFQIYHDSEEGQTYMQFYKVLEWPYIAVIDPRTGENLIVWHKVDASSFCELVTNFLSHHPPFGGQSPTLPEPPKKRQKTDSIVDASEDSQLEAAIRASMLEVARPQEDTEDESSEVETFDSDNEASVMSSKSSNHLDSENTRSSINNSSSSSKELINDSSCEDDNRCHKRIEQDGNSKNEKVQVSWKDFLGQEDTKTKLLLRFPDGKKEQMSLPASSKIKALLLYVESLNFPKEKYELVTNYPRRKLSQLDPSQTLKEIGLFPQETIFIQAR